MSEFGLVRLTVEDVPDHLAHLADMIVPIIDGMPLSCWVGADLLPGVALELVAPPSMQWRGCPHYVEHDQAVVIDGGCGNAGCCGLMATIRVGETSVTWSDFVIGYSRPIELGPFVFDRAAYERTLDRLASMPAVAWVLERVVVDNEPMATLRDRFVDRVSDVVAWPWTAWERHKLRRGGVRVMSIGRNGGWYVEPHDRLQPPDDDAARRATD